MTHEYFQCPFCKEQDFDLIGLKSHLVYGWCDVFSDTLTTDEERAAQGHIPPSDLSEAEHEPKAKTEDKPEKDENIIGNEIDVVLTGFNKGKPITGKVDTGATISSLHAEDIKTTRDNLNDEDLVTFKHNGIKYRMKLETHQAVQTADGGSEYRPVVSFDVQFQDKTYKDIMFNLNNRSDMPFKVLLGKNFIEKGKFLVDASE